MFIIPQPCICPTLFGTLLQKIGNIHCMSHRFFNSPIWDTRDVQSHMTIILEIFHGLMTWKIVCSHLYLNESDCTVVPHHVLNEEEGHHQHG